MRAVLVREWCGPETLKLEDVPDPVPGPKDVLVKIRCAALNFPDLLKIAGKHQNTPELPFTPGTEFCGEVLEIGKEAEGFQIGQQVFAHTGGNAFAEFIAVDRDLLRVVPDSMPDDEAAVFSLVYQTSYIALAHRARLQPGETVLVHSAAGGVGLAAVQIARAMGAGQIIGTVGSDEKRGVVTRHGADVVVNYETEDFVAVVKKLTGGRGADVVYDPLGGEVGERSVKCIAREGRILIIGFTSGMFPTFRANHMLVKNYSVLGLYVRYTNAEAKARCWRELLELYEQGAVTPLVSKRYPMEKAGEAMAYLASRRSVGKIVLYW